MTALPEGFLVGAATAAHQVEGNNIHSDYWAIEQDPHQQSFKEPSGDATDHYHRFREDIDLMAAAGLTAYRFSIEWARIEPTPGSFDETEIQHYREVLEHCHAKGLTPIVSLHHFSSPRWLIAAGGWEDEATGDAFARYCGYVAEQLGDLMGYVCTINEANMGLQLATVAREMTATMAPALVQVGGPLDLGPLMARTMAPIAHLFGDIDPARIAHFLTPRSPAGDAVIGRAHQQARAAIKAAHPALKVGLTLSLHDYQALPGGEEQVAQAREEELLHYLPYLNDDDFLGVQNYTRKVVGPGGVLPLADGTELTQMGYEYYPASIGGVVRFVASQTDLPLLVTENGLATDDDAHRITFIDDALSSIQGCLDDGIDVLGYLHWSLLDNFEWMLGYEKTFGLIAVDRTTQSRAPKPSLSHLGGFAPRR